MTCTVLIGTRRLLAALLLVSGLLLVPVATDACTPQLFFPCTAPTVPTIPTDSDSYPGFATCYVNRAAVGPIPGQTLVPICSLSLDAGTWRFDGIASVQYTGGGTLYYSVDIAGNGSYFGGATGISAGAVTLTFPVIGYATFTTATQVTYRFKASQTTTISIPTLMDTGPTFLLTATRVGA